MKIGEIYKQKCAEPSDINEHLPVLCHYSAKCRHVTEFGVRGVVSTWALIAGLPDIVISYDLESPGQAVLENVFMIAAECHVQFRFWRLDVLKTEIEPTDLLFIDTYHVYSQLKAELLRHAFRVRRWIILHDTEIFGEKGEANEEKGLNYAIREFCAPGCPWQIKEVFTNNNGLTVLERK